MGTTPSSGSNAGSVYVVHFDAPLPGGRRHFIGWSPRPAADPDELASGPATAGTLIRQAARLGIPSRLAVTVAPATKADCRAVKAVGALCCPDCGHEPFAALASEVVGNIRRDGHVIEPGRHRRDHVGTAVDVE